MSADEATRAAPATAASTRFRPPIAAAVRPPTVSISAASSRRPARPDWYGSAPGPRRWNIRLLTVISAAAPAMARLRAGAACSVRASIRPSPPAAVAAELTNRYGSSGWASCQAGTAVSANSAAV